MRRLPSIRIILCCLASLLMGAPPPHLIQASAVSSSSTRQRRPSTSSSTAASSSPVADWGPSWTASAAQGTTVAVACGVRLLRNANDDDNNNHNNIDVGEPEPLPGVVILFRSPPAAVRGGSENDGPSAADPCLRLDDGRLRVHRVDPHRATRAGASRRWTRLGAASSSGTVCCLTGFAVDVDGLTRRLQRAVEDDASVYDRNHRPPALRTARALAELLRQRTQWRNGRPFGVQALLVGPAAATVAVAGSARRPPPRPLSLFTLDPGGGHRHWGAGTAIGKSAARVRRRLHARLLEQPAATTTTTTTTTPLAAATALAVALDAAAGTGADGDGGVAAAAADQYQAIVVWSDIEGIRIAVVDPAELQRIQASLPDYLGSSSTKESVL